MTRYESIKWAAEIAAFQQGKTIQLLGIIDGNWSDFDHPTFSEDRCYRIKPEPKLRAWKRDEVPLDAFFRNKNCDAWFRITSIGIDSFCVLSFNEGARECSFRDLINTSEYSTDGGKTWKACGVEGGE